MKFHAKHRLALSSVACSLASLCTLSVGSELDASRFNTSSVLKDAANAQAANINVTATTHNAISNSVQSLTVDGAVEDWHTLTAFSDDPDDTQLVTDTINWRNATLAHSNKTLYLLYKNRGLINVKKPKGTYIPWGWQTYFDTDNDHTTGFKLGSIGADFMIESTSLSQYTGVNNSWDWQTIDIARVAYRNDTAELAIPLSAIGRPANIRLAFKGDSASVGGTALDFYPDNANSEDANDNFFSYSLKSAMAKVGKSPQANYSGSELVEKSGGGSVDWPFGAVILFVITGFYRRRLSLKLKCV